MPDIEVLHRRAARTRALPPLLFVHGAYMGAWCWDEYVMPELAARGFECRAVSLRGHGGSAGADALDRARLDDYVEDVAYAASRFERAPIVVGHSMGGVVVQHYAQAHPAAGVVLMAGVPHLGLFTASIELGMRAPDLYAQFALLQSGQGHLLDFRRLSAAIFADDMPPNRALAYFERMGRESQRVLAELAWPHVCSVRLPAQMPVAVLGGDQDGLFSADAVRASARWHGTEARMLPGLGHALMLDLRWQTAVDRIADWIESVWGAERVAASGSRRPGAIRARS